MTDQYLHTPNAAISWKQRCALRLLNVFKWKVRVAPLPGLHGVIIFYPHTSNWDFVIGILAKWAVDAPFRWLGKESLFNGLTGKLFGPMLRSWGGEPVERGASTGAIERLAQRFNTPDLYWLCFSPEGTRKYRDHWRSGFYHIALAAKVPLAMVYLDYSIKEIGFVDYIHLSGDIEADLDQIRRIYQGRRGLYHENAAPITLTRPDPP